MTAHLNAHSYYSFLSALPSPAQLAQAAADHGMAALGLTDLGHLSGAVEFYDASREAGVKPILGLDLPVVRGTEGDGDLTGRLTLLAMDMTGWGNLCRLSSALHAHPPPLARDSLPLEALAADTYGLLCLTGGPSGILARTLETRTQTLAVALLNQLKELFPDRLYVQLFHHLSEHKALRQRLAGLAQRVDLPLVAANEIYYLEEGQAELMRLLAAMRLNSRLNEVDAELPPPNAAFSGAKEFTAQFADYPQALSAIGEIIERCQLELPVGAPHYPALRLPGGSTPAQALRQQAFEGARQHYGELSPEIEARLEHEIETIKTRGYTSLFLIMAEIMRYAWEADVPTASRGSAASSLVAHCLGITTPDPMRLNLYFERFLNPARVTPPDIDTDLCSRRRDQVLDFVSGRFGADRVAMVSTVIRFRRRSALREAAKAHGFPKGEVSRLVNALPHRYWGPPDRYHSRRAVAPYEELRAAYPSARHQQLFDQAEAIIGLPRHLSIHPGGVVITPGAMLELVPTQLSSKGVLITQFDLEPIERLGLVKIDLLGIRGLTVVGDVADAIRERQAKPRPKRLEVLEAIPEEDDLTAGLVEKGGTIGCFQIESPGMRRTLREVHARNVSDLMVALALYRPGPLTGGLKDAFVRRHLGQEPVSHLHPALADLLAETHGVILYQEQVLRIAHELAGLSLAEADLLRRAMSHFDPGKQMQTLKVKFVEGALTHSGVDPQIGERLWEMMAAFAGYGFPKAHAASYAVTAWRSAWCKAHFPAEFMAAVLANWGGYYRQPVYLIEARRMGLQVRPPHVNYAKRHFSVSHIDGEPMLFMGLDQVRDLTRSTQRRIMTKRPFHSLADFMALVDPRKGEAENLIRVGALAGLGTIPELLRELEGSKWRAGQLPLFNVPGRALDDWPLEQKAASQEAILGVSVDAHPLELKAREISAADVVTTIEAAERIGQRVRIAGVRQTWRRTTTSSGDHLYFMGLDDLEGSITVVIGGEVYRRDRSEFSGGGPVVIEGLVEEDRNTGEPTLRAERAWQVE